MFEYTQPATSAAGLGSQAVADRATPSQGGVGRFPFALVVIFLIALYSQITLQVPALGAAGGMNVLGGIAIAAVIGSRLLGRGGLELVWPESYLVLALVVAAALSCIGALWPRYALDNTMDLLKFVAVYFLILHTIDSQQRLRTIVWTLVIGGLFPALGTLSNYARGNLQEGRALWIGIFGNPNEVAYGLIILIPLAAFLAVTTRAWQSVFLWGVLALYVGAIAVTFSRGGMLALVAVALLLALRWRSAPVLLASAALVLASAAFLLYGWSRGESFSGLDSDLNLLQRLTQFQGGLAMFLENPFTGVGLGCSLIAWPLYAPAGLYTRSWLVIHNTFVQALSEIGLIGFVSFMFLLGAAIVRCRSLAKSAVAGSPMSRLASALEVSLWGLVLCGMSGGYLLTWFPYILLALVSAIAVVNLAEGEASAQAA